MFRLIKLAGYGLMVYAAYELLAGLSQKCQEISPGKDLSKALNKDQGRMGVLTGAGRGASETTEENSGASATHLIGRGATLHP